MTTQSASGSSSANASNSGNTGANAGAGDPNANQNAGAAGAGQNPPATPAAGDANNQGAAKAGDGKPGTLLENLGDKGAEGDKAGQENKDGQKIERVIPDSYKFEKTDDYPGTDEDIARVENLAKALKLTAEEAKILFDQDVASIKEADEAIMRERAQTRSDNIATLKADPEFGNAKFNESLTRADQALALVDPKGELQAELKEFGLDTHPTLVRAFMRMGKMLSDGNTFIQKPPGDGEQSNSASLASIYPSIK